MNSFDDFLRKIGPVKVQDVSLEFKHQFKVKDSFLNANSKNFEIIV